jgi:O-antigen/teichoic acid export membrane protein
MAIRLKSLFNDSIIYGISGVLSRFVGIFLTPLYTRVYLPSDYGIMGMLNNGYALVTIILVFALDNSTARWFYDTDNTLERKRTINTWLWFYLVFSIIACVVFYLTAPGLSSLMFNDVNDGVTYIRLLGLALPMMVWMAVANNVLRFERKAVPAVILSLTYSLVLIAFSVLFVLYMKLGLLGAYYAQIVASFCSMILSLVLIKDWIGSVKLFDWSRLIAMIKYSLPFVPASIAYWLVNLSGIFFVNAYLSESEAGLYQIGTSIAAVVGLITIAFQQAWAPFAFSIINQGDAKEIYAKVFYLYVLVVGTFCMLIALFAPEALIILTTPKYYGAGWVASILAFSYLAIGLTSIADIGTAIAKKTAPLGFISVISAIILVLLNFQLIPALGKEGAALAICISQFIVPIYMFYRSNKVYPIPYKFKVATLITFYLLAVSIAGRLIDTGNVWYNIVIKLGILLSSVVVFYQLNKNQIVMIVQRISGGKPA